MDEIVKADWNEDLHPRDDHGRFGSGGGSAMDAKAPVSASTVRGFVDPIASAAGNAWSTVEYSLQNKYGSEDTPAKLSTALNRIGEAKSRADKASMTVSNEGSASKVANHMDKAKSLLESALPVISGEFGAKSPEAKSVADTLAGFKNSPIAKADWDEDLHPRDEHGRFGAAIAAVEAAHQAIADNVARNGGNANAEESLATAMRHLESAKAGTQMGEPTWTENRLRDAKAYLADATGSARNIPGHADRLSTMDELNGGPITGRPVVFDDNGLQVKKSSVKKLAKAVKHEAKAVPVDVEGLISPVLKELEGRVAVLESSTPSEAAAHVVSTLDAGVADEAPSLRKQIDAAASAVMKEKLTGEAVDATLAEFYRLTNPS